MIKLTTTGQIKTGDCMVIENKGRPLPYVARKVLNPATDEEK